MRKLRSIILQFDYIGALKINRMLRHLCNFEDCET